MSDSSQGPGWWQASDGRWYEPPAPEMGAASEGATDAAAAAGAAPPSGRSWQRPALLGVGAVAVVVILVAGFLAVQELRSRLPDNTIPIGVDEAPASDLTLADGAVVVGSDGG